MRLGIGGCMAAALTALVVVLPRVAPAQTGNPEVRYWPLRDINFPVPVDQIQAMNPRPAKLRFWVAPNRGKFRQVAERPLNDLDVIDKAKNRRGFRYESPGDGEYDFALQFVYSDGDANPRDDSIGAQYRVVFDTRPPLVRAATAGPTTIEWDVQDDNLKADGVEVQARWLGQQQWSAVSPRPFAARDRYTWNGLDAGRQLEVRIVARDRAGHEGSSQPLAIPTTRAGSGLGGATITRPAAGGSSGFGQPEELPNRSQIDYANTPNLTIESKLTRVTRSGVKEADLWVRDDKSNWRLATKQPVNITPDTPEPAVRIPYQAKKDGLYGFIVVPVNGAGGKQPDPRPGDPAQMLVYVDTEAPVVKVSSVRVSPGGVRGPRVEIEWSVVETNLLPSPIVIEYAANKNAPDRDWKPVTDQPLPNTGRYIWEVEDKALWRFYVRVRAMDKAATSGFGVYDKQVLIVLETPQAVIEKVQGGAPSVKHESDRMPVTPAPVTPPAPAPAPAKPKTEPAKSPLPATPQVQLPSVSPSDGPAIPSLDDAPKK
jgi:hypothetical protein